MADTAAVPLLDAKFLAQLEQLELVSRKIFLGRMKGERRSKRKGQSVEFADYRNYVIGDDLRFLDWNLYARLDKLFLRLFMEEEDLHFYVLIDNSLSQSLPPVRARRSLWRLLDFLNKIEPAGPSDLNQALRTFSLKCSGKG